MNKDKLKESAGELLELITKGVEKGGDVLSEQAPLLLQEVIMYGRVWHTTCSVFWLIVSMLAITLSVRIVKKLKPDLASSDGGIEMLFFFLGLVCLFLSSIFIQSCKVTIMAWCSPRLYILHEISELFKGVQ